jgi:hypothetical protein
MVGCGFCHRAMAGSADGINKIASSLGVSQGLWYPVSKLITYIQVASVLQKEYICAAPSGCY